MHFYYGWLVVGASLAINLMYGIFYAFGVFFTPMRTEFGWTNAETAIALSLHAVTNTVSSILMGKLTDAYGPRLPLWVGGSMIALGLILSSRTETLLQFYLFYGFVASMGVGAMHISTHSTVVKWFVKGRGAALGLVTVGMGLGVLVTPPICDWLIALYGWREAFIYYSALVWVVMMAGGVLVKNPSGEISETFGENLGTTPGSVLRIRVFWLLLTVYVFLFASTYIPITHIVPFAITIGIPSPMAAAALSIYGASSIFGRITIGSLSDKIGRIRALIICSLLIGSSIVSFISIMDTFTLYLLIGIFGYFVGGIAPLMPAVIGDFFGSKSVGGIYGVFTGLAFGIGGGVGPILGGYLKDVMGNYKAAFEAGGLLSLLAIAPLVLIRPSKGLPHD